MKTRIGHVSNSSSSSFIVYGTKVPSNDIPESTNKEEMRYLRSYCDETDTFLFGWSPREGKVEKVFEEIKKKVRKTLEEVGFTGDFESLEFSFHLDWDED